MGYRWEASNYKTKHKESGELATFEAAKAVAEAAKARCGFRETTITITTPTGIVYSARPSERGSGLVWDKTS